MTVSFEEVFPVIKQYLETIGSANCTTEDLAMASKALKECFTHVHSIPALMQIIQTHESQPVRQLASVELRKLVQKDEGVYWENLEVQARQSIKQNILQITINEQRHSLSHVISEMAKNELTKNRWEHLINVLLESCSSSNVRHREIGVYVLYTLFEVIADQLESYLPQLNLVFSKTINDTESLMVQVTTCQALGKIADFVEEQDLAAVEQFQNHIPSIANVLQKCLAQGDDEGCSKICEVFDELLVLEAPLLAKHFVDLLKLFLGISVDQDGSEDIRVQALSFLMWCIMSAQTKIKKANLIPNVIDAMFMIAAEDEPENRDEDYPAKLAIQVINTLATTFSPNLVFPVTMARAAQAIQSQNPGDRKAAMLSVAVLVEGCADFMRPNLDEILEFVVRSMQDSDATVRKAACMALGALSDDFESEVSDKHSVLLPALFNLIDDPDASVHPEALSALDVLLENLGDDVVPYIPGLMAKLVSLWGNSTRKVQITTTNCIGSVAFAAGKEFTPYFNDVISKLFVLMNLVDLGDLPLRAVATDCVGAVATAVGKETFRSQLTPVMEIVVLGMQYESSQLKQCSYVLFGALGRLYEDEFAPFLHVIVPPIMVSCNATEGEFGLVAQETEVIGEEEEQPIFASGIAQEKESSIDTLGELFAATKTAFMPYVPDSINLALSLLDHYHDSVRITAIATLLKFFNTAYGIGNHNEWIPGLPLQKPLHENVANIGKLAIEGVLALLCEEEDRMVVTQGLQYISETLKIAGPATLSQEFVGGDALQGSHLDFLCNLILSIMNGTHSCQQLDDSLVEEEMAELDALVITAAADTVGAIASAIGPQFASYFEKFLPLIAKFYKKPSVADRSMAIGSLAESVEGLEEGVMPFKNALMELFMVALADEDDEVKSNAAYGAGNLCFYTKATEHIPKLLQLLHPLFQSTSNTNIKDNVCGAVCRIILTDSSAVPLDQALETILGCLPLVKDYEENRPIYKTFVKLLNDGNSFLYSKLNVIANLVVLGVKEDQFDRPTKESLKGFFMQLREHRADDFNGLMASTAGSEVILKMIE